MRRCGRRRANRSGHLYPGPVSARVLDQGALAEGPKDGLQGVTCEQHRPQRDGDHHGIATAPPLKQARQLDAPHIGGSKKISTHQRHDDRIVLQVPDELLLPSVSAGHPLIEPEADLSRVDRGLEVGLEGAPVPSVSVRVEE